MASTLRVRVVMSYARDDGEDQYGDTGLLVAANIADTYLRRVQSVGTTEELLATGEGAVSKYYSLRNLDASNYIAVSVLVSGTHYVFARINPGEAMLIRQITTALYVKANTASCDLEIFEVDGST